MSVQNVEARNEMVILILSKLGEIHKKDLDEIYIRDLYVLQRVAEYKKEKFSLEIEEREAFEEEFKDIDYFNLFDEIVTEMKEYVFMVESKEERDEKNRLDKVSNSQNYLYLLEAYDLVSAVFQEAFVAFCKLEAELLPGQVKFCLFNQWLEGEEVDLPKVPDPEGLIKKYQKELEEMEKNLIIKYRDVHDRQEKDVQYESTLKAYCMWGAAGLYKHWDKCSVFRGRVVLKYAGIDGEQNNLFRKTYSIRMKQKVASLDGLTDQELMLYYYIEALNEAIIQIEKAKKCGGMTEKQIALYYYLQMPRDFDEDLF